MLRAWGTSIRLRPETVKMVHNLDRRVYNSKGDKISFNEKVFDLLSDLKKRRSHDTKFELNKEDKDSEDLE